MVEVNAKFGYVENPFSLESLRFEQPEFDQVRSKEILATPTTVERFAADIFEETVVDTERPLVIALGFGGTIAMKEDANGRRVPDLNIEQIINLTDTRIRDRYQLFGFDVVKTDSSQLEIDDAADAVITMSYIWDKMPREIRKIFSGFMIAHGTDSMSKDMAHMLNMHGDNMPYNIVATGSQVPINEFSNDAAANVKHSLLALESMFLEGKADALVVAGGVALLAVGVQKVDDHHARAFGSPLHKEVIDFGTNPDPRDRKRGLILPTWLRDRPGIATRFEPTVYRGLNTVGLLKPEMSEDPESIEAQMHVRKAMIIETYGSSTFDMAQAQQIGRIASELDIPVFALSPLHGQLDFDAYAAGTALAEAAQAVPAHMTSEAARAKIMRARADAHKANVSFTDYVRDFVPENFLGEIPTDASMKSKYEILR